MISGCAPRPVGVLEARSLGAADEVVRLGRGRMEMVHLPGATVARSILPAGWRWSEDVGPSAPTASCQLPHLGYVVSGRLHVLMDTGAEHDLAPGDAHAVGAGHDAWVVGSEPVVIVDFIARPQDARSNDNADQQQRRDRHMYGTVVRYRIKPGSEEALLKLSAELTQDPPACYVGSYLFRLDSGGDEYMVASVWSDREAYQRNSEDERQQRWFARASELIVGEPQWTDGEVLEAVHLPARVG